MCACLVDVTVRCMKFWQDFWNICIIVQISDSTEYVAEALSSFVEQCVSLLLRNVTLWEVKGGVLAPPLSALDQLCHNRCNQQGDCQEGMQKLHLSCVILVFQLVVSLSQGFSLSAPVCSIPHSTSPPPPPTLREVSVFLPFQKCASTGSFV